MGEDGFVAVVVANAVVLMVPILWAALGEAIVEKSGVLNVGIEGVMLLGAFGAAVGLRLGDDLWTGVMLAIALGLLCGAILSYLYVSRGTDQIVTGIMFTTLALGLTTTMNEKWLSTVTRLSTFDELRIPLLADLPVVGAALFEQTPLGYGAFLMAAAVFYLMRRTWFGLYSSAIAERPAVGEAAGLSVHGLRWVAVTIGCVFAAIGGASLVLDQTGSFVPGGTSGQGFIALMVVILARWNPFAIIASAGLFGVATALQFQLQTVKALADVPDQVWLSLPYVVTIAAVALARNTQYPASVGIPFRGKVAG